MVEKSQPFVLIKYLIQLNIGISGKYHRSTMEMQQQLKFENTLKLICNFTVNGGGLTFMATGLPL